MADNFKSVTVLVVDDEVLIRDLLGDTLQAIGYEVETAEGFDAAVKILKGKNIDVVITDIMMPVKSGVDLIKLIKEQYPQVPVLAISGKGVPQQSVFDAGADGFLTKPFRIGVVEELIEKTLLRYDIAKAQKVTRQKKILVVDDEPAIVSTLKDSLEALGYQSVGASNGKEALQLVDKDAFDLVITDIRMPEKSGIDLLHQLKERHPELPVVIITGYPLAA